MIRRVVAFASVAALVSILAAVLPGASLSVRAGIFNRQWSCSINLARPTARNPEK